MTAREIWVRLNGAKYRYVAITTLVSLLAFARNLMFMKTLDLAALGQIALMQTLVMLVGFFQFGLINGAYIQYSARNPEINRRIVELVTTGLLLLVPMAAVVATVVQVADLTSAVVWQETLVIGLGAGIATLASTWMNNALVADGLLGKSNLVSLGAILLSLLIAFLSGEHGLTAALLSIFVQPVTIVLVTLLINPQLRPNTLGIHGATLKQIFRLGSTPFVGGVAVLAMHQIERWSIAAILGSIALGQFYIVMMYATFFALIPAGLLNVFFPQAKRAHADQQSALLRDLIRRHLLDLVVYFVLATVVTIMLMPWTVARFLPEAAASTDLVYYALPGLILFTMRDSASLVLFTTGHMRPLLIAGAMTLGLFCLGLFALWSFNRFSLVSVLMARMFATLPGTALLAVAQRRQAKEIVAYP